MMHVNQIISFYECSNRRTTFHAQYFILFIIILIRFSQENNYSPFSYQNNITKTFRIELLSFLTTSPIRILIIQNRIHTYIYIYIYIYIYLLRNNRFYLNRIIGNIVLARKILKNNKTFLHKLILVKYYNFHCNKNLMFHKNRYLTTFKYKLVLSSEASLLQNTKTFSSDSLSLKHNNFRNSYL